MCGESCEKCEMPMMVYEGRTRCIFCQEDVGSEELNFRNNSEEVLAAVQEGEKVDDASTSDPATDLEVMVDPQGGAEDIDEVTLNQPETEEGVEAATESEDTDCRGDEDFLSEEVGHAETKLLENVDEQVRSEKFENKNKYVRIRGDFQLTLNSNCLISVGCLAARNSRQDYKHSKR